MIHVMLESHFYFAYNLACSVNAIGRRVALTSSEVPMRLFDFFHHCRNTTGHVEVLITQKSGPDSLFFVVALNGVGARHP